MNSKNKYWQNTQNCFGKRKLEAADVSSLNQEAELALEKLLEEKKQGQLPIISLCEESTELAEIFEIANHLKANFDNLIILGTGGSTLCGHTLAGFMQFPKNGCKTIFMQNIDPLTVNAIFDAIDIKRTAFLVISKSGESIETLVQFSFCMERVKAANGNVASQFLLLRCRAIARLGAFLASLVLEF